MESDWAGHFERERERFEDGIARLPDMADPDERQRQLTRVANALYGAGLALLMQGRSTEGADLLLQAAERYRESYPAAPPGSWGRPIGAIKARVMAGDWHGAADDARWALDGASAAESPIGRYAASLALLVLHDDSDALEAARSLRGSDFPDDVARTLLALAEADRSAYMKAIGDVLRSFEMRDEYLEDIAVADTVVVLEALAHRRGFAAGLESPLLPARRQYG
jgi:hypothetical protein